MDYLRVIYDENIRKYIYLRVIYDENIRKYIYLWVIYDEKYTNIYIYDE